MIVNVYDARAAASRADQVKILNQHRKQYPGDPCIKYVPPSKADIITVNPGEKKTIYTDMLVSCTDISTISRVSGHPSHPDNAIVATMSHNLNHAEQKQIQEIEKFISDNRLEQFGQKHAIVISLVNYGGQKDRMYDKINEKLGGDAELISLPRSIGHPDPEIEHGWAKAGRGLIVDIFNDEQFNRPVEYDLFASNSGSVYV